MADQETEIQLEHLRGRLADLDKKYSELLERQDRRIATILYSLKKAGVELTETEEV